MSKTKDFFVGSFLLMVISGSSVAAPFGSSVLGGQGNNAVAHVVQVIPPKKGIYDSKTVLNFTVRFNKPVYVMGEPSLPLGIGTSLREGKYVSGSGSRTLKFEVAPKPGDKAKEGVRLINALVSDGANIILDKNGNPADVTLPARTITNILVDDALPALDDCRYISSINGQTPPLVAASAIKSEVANDRLMQTGDGYGKRSVSIKTTRAVGSRSPIHEHEYGGVTTVVQGEMTLYMEGHAPLRAVAGVSYYMPAGHVMTGVNTGNETAIMYDSYVAPVYARYWRPVEPGFNACTSG